MARNRPRKLVVDDKHYTFSIGKKFVKISNGKDFSKVVPREQIGKKIYKNCKRVDGEYVYEYSYIHTPGMIAEYIRKGSVEDYDKFFPNCGHSDTQFGVAPFAAEIYSKTHYVCWCKDCFQRNAWEI